MRYALILILTLAVCFGAQNRALHAVGGRTTKSESNYFSSLGRIQAGTVGKPEVMLLGSSITGRLPDRAQGFEGFANMGCDGGSAIDSLRAMDKELLPSAQVLVVETNTLHLELELGPSEVGKAMSSPWFQAGMLVPAVSAYARPAAFAYSKLLAGKIGSFGDPKTGPDLNLSNRPQQLAQLGESGRIINEQPLADELIPLVRRLKQRGCRLVFVSLPPGGKKGAPAPAWIQTTVASTGAEWWDIGGEADPAFIQLTDGVHMSADSAARTVRTLAKELP